VKRNLGLHGGRASGRRKIELLELAKNYNLCRGSIELHSRDARPFSVSRPLSGESVETYPCKKTFV